jgi:cation diffusion facilitator CzcD-associated flavoprotein CzcO
LCAAKHLRAHGLEVTVFELGSRIGGLWVYNNDSGMSPAYRSLHINSEARVSSYTDFPVPDDGPLYPDHEEMERYFRAYADRFGITERIRFKSRVVAIEPEGSGYRVRLENGTRETFDGVVVATGHQSNPRHPPEVSAFTGSTCMRIRTAYPNRILASACW